MRWHNLPKRFGCTESHVTIEKSQWIISDLYQRVKKLYARKVSDFRTRFDTSVKTRMVRKIEIALASKRNMTLKEFAGLLNLSPTTVSRALNGYPEVSEETRRRVFVAAEQHNYLPNTRARRLATGCAMAIGHVLPMATKHEMVNPVFADFIGGAGETYSRAGYDLLLSVVGDGEEEAFYRNLAANGSVDGVVVHGPKVNDGRIALLQDVGLPFVVHGRSSEVTQTYDWLDVNNRSAFYRATRFLLDLGHRRIALINGLADMDFAMRRRDGFLSALQEAGIEADPSMMFHDEMTETYGYASCKTLLAHATPPTAFLVSSIIPALGLRRALEEAGLRAGKEVSVVIHDDDLSYFRNDQDVPIFTAVRSSVRAAGQQLADMLLESINTPSSSPRNVLLEADLTIGQSTGPAPS